MFYRKRDEDTEENLQESRNRPIRHPRGIFRMGRLALTSFT